MTYQDRYSYYYNQIPGDIDSCVKSKKVFAFGYTSNLDVVIKRDEKAFAQMMSDHLKQEPYYIEGETIDSLETLARIVSHHIINGIGGEIDITNTDVCDYIENTFRTEFRVGGTCAQGSAALNAIGFPVVIHITDRSEEVCGLIDGPMMNVVTQDGMVPIMHGATDELPVRHMILQYSKGEKIKIGDQVYKAPVSNRLILDYDTIHKYVPIDRSFLDYCESNAQDMIAYSISGFNAITDPAIMEKRAEELVAHYKAVKLNNPRCRIYLEAAHYMNASVQNMVFDKFSGVMDILGVNEEELVSHNQKFGLNTDKDNLESVLEGLNFMIGKYPVPGIVLHTKDYSMYYGQPIPGTDMEKGLTMGNLMSGTRARIGKYGTCKECEESFRLPLSPVGVEFAQRLAHMQLDKTAVLVPSRYMEKPKYTIGLGDTFMAGCMLAFLNA